MRWRRKSVITKQEVPQMRIFRWDKTLKRLGSVIPNGAEVVVTRFLPRRRVLVEYQGQVVHTPLWCVRKL